MAEKKIHDIFYSILVNLLYYPFTSRPLKSLLNKSALWKLDSISKSNFSSNIPRIEQEKKRMVTSIIESMANSIQKKNISREVAKATLKLWIRALKEKESSQSVAKSFYQRNGTNPPFFLVVSPGHACNLKCKGCYAGSISKGENLSWKILDELIDQARRLWGIKLVVFSGGEPFAYHSEGKDILDITAKHQDCLFLAFTNGTLVNDETASRIAACKNITLAFSVEGMQESTDVRRGEGTFEKVLQSIGLIKEAGAPFGISVTVNRKNYLKVLDKEFIDFFFKELGAFYGFYFQYLPIGRNIDFELMPTPKQRSVFMEKMWKTIEQEKLFLIDFGNHGPLVNGCLAAGREGGYLYVDWNGNIMPCVFAPVIAGNINEIFEKGQDLNDIYDLPILRSVRQWQKEYGYKADDLQDQGNLLMSCPYRDHYVNFLKLTKDAGIKSKDYDASAVFNDQEYKKKLSEYDKELKNILDPIWQRTYMEESGK